MLLAGDQGLQSSTHSGPLNPALFLCGRNRQKPQTLLFFKGYESASITQILIPRVLILFPKEYNMLHHGLVMQMWQRRQCEAGEGHCVDLVPQGCRRCVGAHQGSHSWRDGADLLVWGCPMGVCVKGERCKEQECSWTGLWDGLWKAGGQRQLKQQGFWQGTVQLPRSSSWCCGGCAHRHFHPRSRQEAPRTFTSTCKEGRNSTDSQIFLSLPWDIPWDDALGAGSWATPQAPPSLQAVPVSPSQRELTEVLAPTPAESLRYSAKVVGPKAKLTEKLNPLEYQQTVSIINS